MTVEKKIPLKLGWREFENKMLILIDVDPLIMNMCIVSAFDNKMTIKPTVELQEKQKLQFFKHPLFKIHSNTRNETFHKESP